MKTIKINVIVFKNENDFDYLNNKNALCNSKKEKDGKMFFTLKRLKVIQMM